MKRIIKILIAIILIPLLTFIIFLIYSTLTRYKPAEITELSAFQELERLSTEKSYTILIWNIGYCGLAKEMDFFYDGGQNVRSSEDHVRRNQYKIGEFISAADSIDFLLLQEVDLKSKRSYFINQLDYLNILLEDHFPFFAYNYKVGFVPVPPESPYGRVESGLLTFTGYFPTKVSRYSFPGNYPWPKNVFMLNRCFLVNRYPLDNGKDLLMINTHNSAYDNGDLRKQQMGYLKDFLTDERNNGNAIIVGGDWNQCPPGFKPNFTDELFDTVNYSVVTDDFFNSDWRWVYCDSVPSNRRVMEPYTNGLTPTTVIDYYLCSDNIVVEEVFTIDLDFRWSDHQPVFMKFSIRK